MSRGSKPAMLLVAVMTLAAALVSCSGDHGGPSRSFDGKTSVRLPFDAKATAETYTVDILLKSRTVPSDPDYENTETTPPMPFRLGRLGASLTAEGYRFWQRQADETILVNATVGDPAEFTRLTFVGGPDCLIIYVNGGEAVRTAYPAPLTGPALAGVGHRKRYWRGEIAYFDIYDQMKVLGEFDPKAGRFDEEGRIASLPLK
ncbi:hypothetical protein [Hyphococcus sp.]|uniref:hypothetical protein n=1 Tax=Hyphococcus sp. TaxID=2038636 RepID=UPI0035C7544C